MTKPIARLGDVMPAIRIPEKTQCLPSVKATPKPAAQKVAGKTPRLPINKQAAMVVRPERCWLFQPVQASSKPPTEDELALLQSKLKTLQNANAGLSTDLGKCREKNRILCSENLHLMDELEAVRKDAAKNAVEMSELRIRLKIACLL